MTWHFVVETESISPMSGFIDARRVYLPLSRSRRGAIHRRTLAIGGTQRVAPEQVLDVSQQQLLMLLLVVAAKNATCHDIFRAARRQISQQGSEFFVNVLPILEYGSE